MIQIGQTEKIAFTFTDANGDLANPAGITVYVYRLTPDAPDSGLELVATFTKDDMENPSAGEWYVYYTPDASGIYYVYMFTTETGDTPTVAKKGEFSVANALA